MIPFKNHRYRSGVALRAMPNMSPGFTLMEILLAVMIIGMIVTAALNLQNQSLTSIIKFSNRLQNLFLAENRLIEIRESELKKEGITPEKKIEKSATTLSYKVSKPGKDSALAPLKDLIIEKITVTWQERDQQKTENIVALRYKPEEKKEEKK